MHQPRSVKLLFASCRGRRRLHAADPERRPVNLTREAVLATAREMNPPRPDPAGRAARRIDFDTVKR
jgi:hypothetical protein